MSALTFRALRTANLDRLPQFRNAQGAPAHDQADGSDWSLNDWLTAVAGEVGELANLLKKIRRGDFTLEEMRRKVAGEISDIVIYLDILAYRCGVDLDAAVIDTFNAKSQQVGATTRLAEDEPYLQARYDILARELQRVRQEAAATQAAASAEIAVLRRLLGLRSDAAVTRPRNFGDGHG